MGLILFLNLLVQIPNNQNFEKIFGEKYTYAQTEIRSIKDLIDSITVIYNANEMLTAAIIFPELIRYSIVRDFIEINSMELVYVNTGLADFSIGPFQIKPSFAEKIEQLVVAEKLLRKYIPIFHYPMHTPLEIRKERVSRLKDIEMQLHYVSVYQKYMYIKHPFLRHKPIEYQLKFLSTAYNSGFQLRRKEIEKGMDKEYFPWGALSERKKYNYSEIAWYFYTKEFLEEGK